MKLCCIVGRTSLKTHLPKKMRHLFFIALVAAASQASAQVVPRDSAAPTSLTIEQAIELARRNNPELQQILNNRIGARAGAQRIRRLIRARRLASARRASRWQRSSAARASGQPTGTVSYQSVSLPIHSARSSRHLQRPMRRGRSRITGATSNGAQVSQQELTRPD